MWYVEGDPIALSSDGRMVLLVGTRSLKVWDMESGSFIAILQKTLNWTWNGFLGFSKDNSKVIVGNMDTIFVWDIASQALIVKASGSIIGPAYADSARTERITAVLMDGGYYGVRKDTALSLDLRDGTKVVIGSLSNSIFVWDISGVPSGTGAPPLLHSTGNVKGAIRLLSTDKGRLRVSFPASVRLTPFSKILIYRLSGCLMASVAITPDAINRGICSINQPQNLVPGVYLYHGIGIHGSFSGSKGTLVVK